MLFRSKLAAEFLDTLPNERAEWAGLLSTWSAARGLSEGEAAAVRLAVFHLRMRAAVERSTRRRQR